MRSSSMVTAVKSDISKRSLVLQAATKQDLPEVVSLLKRKASPFQGRSCCSDGRDKEILFLLLRCLNINFRSLYDLSHWLFPTLTHLTPPLIHKIRYKTPHSKAVSEFDAKKKTLAITPFNDLQLMETVVQKLDIAIPSFSCVAERSEYLEEQSLNAPLEVVQQTLSQMHPLFDLAWTLTSNPIPIKLVEKPKGNTYTYSFHNHTMVLGSRSSFQDLIRKLVFFTFLALHRETLQSLYNRPLDRESHTVIRSYMQYRIEQLTEDFLRSIFPKVFNSSRQFEDFWRDHHVTAFFIEPERSHWAKKNLIQHLHQNPLFFAEKLEGLRNTSSSS